MKHFLTASALVFLLGLLSLACSNPPEEMPSCCSGENAVAPEAEPQNLPDTSVYLLDTKWQDQTAAERQLQDFQGEVVVMAMVFTNCQYACPRILVDLQNIESQIPKEQLSQVRWLLVSMDSDRDTPEVLQAYAESNELDTSRWTLLHGNDFAVRGIAAALGVRYKKDANGNFAHSNIITVLDQEGRIAHQLQGLGAESSSSVAAIQELCKK
jgi:protein SCO1/2